MHHSQLLIRVNQQKAEPCIEFTGLNHPSVIHLFLLCILCASAAQHRPGAKVGIFRDLLNSHTSQCLAAPRRSLDHKRAQILSWDLHFQILGSHGPKLVLRIMTTARMGPSLRLPHPVDHERAVNLSPREEKVNEGRSPPRPPRTNERANERTCRAHGCSSFLRVTGYWDDPCDRSATNPSALASV